MRHGLAAKPFFPLTTIFPCSQQCPAAVSPKPCQSMAKPRMTRPNTISSSLKQASVATTTRMSYSLLSPVHFSVAPSPYLLNLITSVAFTSTVWSSQSQNNTLVSLESRPADFSCIMRECL